MNKKSKITFYLFMFLLVFTAGEALYLVNIAGMKEESLEKKNRFVKIIGLPDLAFSSQDGVLRHRSLGDVFTLYKDAPSLRESFSSSFVINHFENKKSDYEK
jgi:hypothetical protein